MSSWALSGIEALLLWRLPETARTKSGALASLRPHVSVPIQARETLAQLTPVIFASWAVSGFYFSLMPALVRVATGATLPIVGGLVVAALTFSSVTAVLSLRNILANRVLLGAIPARQPRAVRRAFTDGFRLRIDELMKLVSRPITGRPT